MLTLKILLSVFVIFLMVYFAKLHFYWRRKNIKNSFKASTIGVLNLFLLQENLGCVCDKLYQSSKEKFIGFFFLGKPVLLVKDLKVIKRILIKDFDNFYDRTVASLNKTGDPLGTRTIFIEKNPVWKFMRSKIANFFSSGKMKMLFPQICRNGDNFVEYLTANQGKPIDMKEFCPKYSTDVTTSCAFGVEENCFKNDKALSREASRRIFVCNVLRGIQFVCYFVSPFLTKLFNMKWLDPSSSDFVKTSLYDGIKTRRLTEGPRDDFVGGLFKLEEKNIYYKDPAEIVAQAAQFFLAGFETVSSTLTFALYEIAHNKEIQTKLRESINNHLDENGEIIYDTVVGNEYLTNIINETTRKYPILPFLDRLTRNDYDIPEANLRIDAGTYIYVSLFSIQRDPNYYPNPLKFDPDRFTEENKSKLVSGSFMPFGDGPRNCIGARFGKLSVGVALVKLVKNFDISISGKFEEIQFDPKGLLLSPLNKIELVFKKI